MHLNASAVPAQNQDKTTDLVVQLSELAGEMTPFDDRVEALRDIARGIAADVGPDRTEGALHDALLAVRASQGIMAVMEVDAAWNGVAGWIKGNRVLAPGLVRH